MGDRLGRRALIAAILAGLATGVVGAQEAPLTLGQAVGRLARERSFAESGAGLLKRYAAGDPAAMLEGQKLYDAAKASFDELVTWLQTDLDAGTVPSASPELQQALQAAVEQRLAFSRYVDGAVKVEPGARAGVADALAQGAGAIIKGVLDGALAIWQEYHKADQLRRQAITNRIEAQRWKPFGEVPSA
jgi:hypothetical protein